MAAKKTTSNANHKTKLIASLTSPYTRKVRIVASEKRIDYELVVDIPWNEETEVPKHNPLGKVPVWVPEDGKAIFDSRVIVEYLDGISPVSHLLPKDARARIAVKRWEALADGLCDAAALAFLERKRPAKQQDKAWIERQMNKVRAALEEISEDLGQRDWCHGESYSLADIAVGCALGYLDLRFKEEIDWRRSHPNLAELYDRLMQRPAFKETVPPAA
ncbi:MAG: glutathione S-transferase N-terminal domain-containing protein [Hydrogenophilaceae bacterium]|nr:glutathione S-transferase N-terminal domain-containing protein [Hydrogenophilaceae bacterium]